jgi:hypothetical protein
MRPIFAKDFLRTPSFESEDLLFPSDTDEDAPAAELQDEADLGVQECCFTGQRESTLG